MSLVSQNKKLSNSSSLGTANVNSHALTGCLPQLPYFAAFHTQVPGN